MPLVWIGQRRYRQSTEHYFRCVLKTVVSTPASCGTNLIQQAIVTNILTSLRPALLCHPNLETFRQKVIIYENRKRSQALH